MAGVKENYHQLKSDLIKVKHTLDLVAALPRFFREQITVQQAEEDIKRLLDTREERFLELVCSQIYERPDSPYLPLLRNAGCEFSDLESNVHRSGLEETLAKLAGEGVYLTSDEFKGKKEITRGRQSFRVSPDRFERRDFHPGFVTHSSGTRNQPVRSMTSLDWIATRTPAAGIFIYAHDLFSHSHALYDAILPASGFFHLFFLAKLGKASDRWFARKIPVRNWLEGRFHELATSLMVFMGNRFGPGFPKPELIDVGEIDRIVRWVESTRRAGKNCFITTVASSAARIARVASQMGISLEGTKISVAGEPLTEFKEQVIKDAGASITSRYSYGGAVTVGFGCANPSHRDEIHVSQDLLALISHSRSVGGGDSSIAPLLCTTLHPLAPRVFLNVENGDYATLEKRDCGCALEKVGYSIHLHHIRSFEKFTSEGMNYFYGDIFELFEKILPAEFGGAPGDYQLIEEEDDNGQTRLTLVVHPEVGQVDEGVLLTRLRKALSIGPRSNDFMTKLWEEAGTFRIKREVPYASARGKILPLRVKPRN